MEHTLTSRMLFVSFAFIVLFTGAGAAETTDLASNANVDTLKKGTAEQSKMKFVKIKTANKKYWKISKEYLETYDTRMLQCFCPDNPLVQVDCEDLESCFNEASPFDPAEPWWWENESGRKELGVISATVQKMGMKLKVKEKANRVK